MVNRKRLVLGIVALVIMIVGYNLIDAYLKEKKEEHVAELIQIAQNAEIGEGVTLQQGIQAYFGTSADWGSINHTEGKIDMRVTSRDGVYFWIIFQVNEKTGQVSLLEGYWNGKSLSSLMIDMLISSMIQAAKG